MKDFPAFLIIIKTNFGKIIALFIDSKYESTIDMFIEEYGEKRREKETNNDEISPK